MSAGVPVDAAIIGLGWWGTTLVDAVNRPDAPIRFVHGVAKDIDDDVQAFALGHSMTLSDDMDEALADPAVKALVLATPHSLHVNQICAAADAGKPVFSEKPLALTLSEAIRAVQACARAGVVLGLGNDKRFLPAVAELTRRVNDGVLGELLHLEAQYSNANSLTGVLSAWRASPDEAPGAGITGPGLHALDNVVNLGGPARTVTAVTHEYSGPPTAIDTVAAVYELISGATAAVSTVRGVPDVFRLQACGTRGWAEVREFGTLTTAKLGEEPTVESFPTTLALDYLLGEFAGAVTGERAFPVTTHSMLATVAAFEATVAAIASGIKTEVETSEACT